MFDTDPHRKEMICTLPPPCEAGGITDYADRYRQAPSPAASEVLIVQAVKVPEVRNLVLSVAKAATGEGVRTSIFTTRDLLFGAPVQVPYTVLPAQQGGLSMGIPDVGLQQISTRSLGTLLLFIFMPIIIFLAGRRAALA